MDSSNRDRPHGGHDFDRINDDPWGVTPSGGSKGKGNDLEHGIVQEIELEGYTHLHDVDDEDDSARYQEKSLRRDWDWCPKSGFDLSFLLAVDVARLSTCTSLGVWTMVCGMEFTYFPQSARTEQSADFVASRGLSFTTLALAYMVTWSTRYTISVVPNPSISFPRCLRAVSKKECTDSEFNQMHWLRQFAFGTDFFTHVVLSLGCLSWHMLQSLTGNQATLMVGKITLQFLFLNALISTWSSKARQRIEKIQSLEAKKMSDLFELALKMRHAAAAEENSRRNSQAGSLSSGSQYSQEAEYKRSIAAHDIGPENTQNTDMPFYSHLDECNKDEMDPARSFSAGSSGRGEEESRRPSYEMMHSDLGSFNFVPTSNSTFSASSRWKPLFWDPEFSWEVAPQRFSQIPPPSAQKTWTEKNHLAGHLVSSFWHVKSGVSMGAIPSASLSNSRKSSFSIDDNEGRLSDADHSAQGRLYLPIPGRQQSETTVNYLLQHPVASPPRSLSLGTPPNHILQQVAAAAAARAHMEDVQEGYAGYICSPKSFNANSGGTWNSKSGISSLETSSVEESKGSEADGPEEGEDDDSGAQSPSSDGSAMTDVSVDDGSPQKRDSRGPQETEIKRKKLSTSIIEKQVKLEEPAKPVNPPTRSSRRTDQREIRPIRLSDAGSFTDISSPGRLSAALQQLSNSSGISFFTDTQGRGASRSNASSVLSGWSSQRMPVRRRQHAATGSDKESDNAGRASVLKTNSSASAFSDVSGGQAQSQRLGDFERLEKSERSAVPGTGAMRHTISAGSAFSDVSSSRSTVRHHTLTGLRRPDKIPSSGSAFSDVSSISAARNIGFDGVRYPSSGSALSDVSSISAARHTGFDGARYPPSINEGSLVGNLGGTMKPSLSSGSAFSDISSVSARPFQCVALSGASWPKPMEDSVSNGSAFSDISQQSRLSKKFVAAGVSTTAGPEVRHPERTLSGGSAFSDVSTSSRYAVRGAASAAKKPFAYINALAGGKDGEPKQAGKDGESKQTHTLEKSVSLAPKPVEKHLSTASAAATEASSSKGFKRKASNKLKPKDRTLSNDSASTTTTLGTMAAAPKIEKRKDSESSSVSELSVSMSSSFQAHPGPGVKASVWLNMGVEDKTTVETVEVSKGLGKKEGSDAG